MKIKITRVRVRVKIVKLPRKRKKRYIKSLGRKSYFDQINLNDEDFQHNWDQMQRKFPKSFYPYDHWMRGRVKEYW